MGKIKRAIEESEAMGFGCGPGAGKALAEAEARERRERLARLVAGSADFRAELDRAAERARLLKSEWGGRGDWLDGYRQALRDLVADAATSCPAGADWLRGFCLRQAEAAGAEDGPEVF